jgi:hypothetical protein
MSAPRETGARAHADHDPSLVAAYAAGDATGRELAEVETLVASCADCADLDRDLRAIMGALPTMPAPVRTRDFRITVEQAAALRPRGLARLLAPLASARFAFAGPAGAGLAALGIAGLLLSGGFGQGVVTADRAAAPVTSTAGSGAGFAAPAPTVAPAPTDAGGPAVAPALTPLDHAVGVGSGTPKATGAPIEANAQGGSATTAPASAAPAPGPTGLDQPADAQSPVTGPAVLLLGAGVVLLTLRVGARRAVGTRGRSGAR